MFKKRFIKTRLSSTLNFDARYCKSCFIAQLCCSHFPTCTANPATLAAVDSVTHYVGDTVVIDMYASTLTPLTDDIISWEFNDTLITNGTFSNSQTTLTIENVQLSDAGVYTIIVVISGGQCSSSSTTLHILG